MKWWWLNGGLNLGLITKAAITALSDKRLERNRMDHCSYTISIYFNHCCYNKFTVWDCKPIIMLWIYHTMGSYIDKIPEEYRAYWKYAYSFLVLDSKISDVNSQMEDEDSLDSARSRLFLFSVFQQTNILKD